MIPLPLKSELLVSPILYNLTDLAPIITKFFNSYLGHLNLKDFTLNIPSIELGVVSDRNSLTVSMPYSNTYGYYKVWNWGILYYQGIPSLFLVNDESDTGPLVYLLGDPNIVKTIFYIISQEMEIVKDGFAYFALDSTLNYQNDPNDLPVLN